ncbi:MAG: tetratricopeptide repeat protein [Blastocatellia bacterium]|nr:tetratricopeptide repeat protein [Blastocatellia bacterium]
MKNLTRARRRVGRAAAAGVLLLLVPMGSWGQPARSKPAPKAAQAESGDAAKQAEALFEAGQNAHAKGELEKAVEQYTAALTRDPALWQAGFQLSAACFSLKRFSDARGAIARVLEQLREYADSTELREVKARAEGMLGEVELAEARRPEAEAAFRRALALSPKAARAHAGLAEILLEAGKTEEAIPEAKAALEAGDDRLSTLLLLGEALIQAKRFEEALPMLTEAIRREPRNGVAFRYRAEIALAGNRFDEAIADMRTAETLDPRPETRQRLAEIYVRAKKIDEAIALYRQIVTEQPGNTHAQTALAALTLESGQAGEAVAQLETLLKAEPNRADIRAKLAELLLPTAPEKALEQYAAAAKLEPNQPQYLIGVGSALVKLRRFQEAIPAMRQALAKGPREDLAYFAHTNLATALFELDDFQGAAREFIWILDHQQAGAPGGDRKRAAITLYFLGICFDKLGDYEQALKAYNQFMTIATADNQLEIEKIKLRMPSLQRQIKEGKGRKK